MKQFGWIKGAALAAVIFATSVAAAFAQQTAPIKTSAVWWQQGRLASPISVTSSSAATQLPAAGQVALLCNQGTVDAYVAFGSSSISTLATTGSLLKAGTCSAYDLMPTGQNPARYAYVAALTASATTTIYVETGLGTPPGVAGGGSGGGGSGGAVFGPTASGGTAANPPVLIGGTADGTGTGTIGNLKVTGGLAYINCANCSGSGASAIDEAAFVAGTSVLSPAGGFFQTTATANPLTNGQQGMLQLTAQRAAFVNLRSAAGAELGIAAAPLQISLANTAANATAVKVDGSASTQPISGTVTANAGTNLNTSLLALETGGNLAQIVTDFGAPGATACGTDTASCSLNQQMQRLAQRLTTINTTLGTPFQAGASIGNTAFGISGTLPAFASPPTVVLTAETTKVIGTVNQGTSPWVVSGTVTANAGTNLNTSLLALEGGGNLASLVTQLGAVTASPTANTVNDRLKTLNTTLGSPLQAGGTVTVAGGALESTQTSVLAAISAGTIAPAVPGTPNVTQVLTVQGAASMTPVATNMTQVAGSSVATGHGTASGSLRVELPTDGTGLVTTNPATAANWGIGATGSAPPANAVYIGANGSGATGGLQRGMITCDQHAIYDASDNGSIEMIAAVSGRTVYICGYMISTGGTATNLKLVDGTGTNCATGTPVNLTPAYQLVANDTRGANSAFWNGLKATNTARAVCINASAGNAHQAEIWYAII